MPLAKALSIVQETKTKIDEIPGNKGLLLKGKLTSVLNMNPDLGEMERVVRVMEGSNEVLPEGQQMQATSSSAQLCQWMWKEVFPFIKTFCLIEDINLQKKICPKQ